MRATLMIFCESSLFNKNVLYCMFNNMYCIVCSTRIYHMYCILHIVPKDDFFCNKRNQKKKTIF